MDPLIFVRDCVKELLAQDRLKGATDRCRHRDACVLHRDHLPRVHLRANLPPGDITYWTAWTG